MTRKTQAQDRGERPASAGVERELKFIVDRRTLKAALARRFSGATRGRPNGEN